MHFLCTSAYGDSAMQAGVDDEEIPESICSSAKQVLSVH
jgi:hypothetical protein